MQQPETIHQSEALTRAREDIARLKAVVEAQGDVIDRLGESITKLADAVQGLRDDMSTAKGGWQMLLLMGGVSAAMGGAVAWFIEHVLRR